MTTDLLARLAQIQNAHGGKIYRDMSMDEKLNMQEEVADLALDALAKALDWINGAKGEPGLLDTIDGYYQDVWSGDPRNEELLTVLRELRAGRGEGAGQ